jgi:hypothetical protein
LLRKKVNGDLEGRRWNEKDKNFKNGSFDSDEI